MATSPYWRCQRKMAWTTEIPCLAAIRFRSGSRSIICCALRIWRCSPCGRRLTKPSARAAFSAAPTSPEPVADDHPSGSDRLAEACTLLGLDGDDVVVNVQGDEPLIDPALIGAVAQLLHTHPHASMGTGAHPLAAVDELANPNVVKVVCDAGGMAQYFSRAPIPFARDHAGQPWWRSSDAKHPALAGFAPLRHIGIYSYRAGFLRRFPELPQAPTEVIEALEQLRALWHGHRIAVHVSATAPGPGVDTPEDLARVRALCT